MESNQIDVIRNSWKQIQPEIKAAHQHLWNEPELPLMEYKSANYLCEWLRRHQFRVTHPAGGLPTAFLAAYGKEKSPAVCVLVEYDALPGVGNEAVPYHHPTAHQEGHGCGHNQIGAANAGAAIAARYAIEQLQLAGRIVVVGCPAEEIIYGKLVLFDQGVFSDVGILLTSHGDRQNGVVSRPCQSVIETEMVFSGLASHTGSPRKYNALEAAELAVQTFERLRGHHFPDGSVEHIYRRAGTMPSITPEETRLWLVVRHANFERAGQIYDFIVTVCKHAATITGTSMKDLFIAASHGYLPNDTLAKVIFRNLQIVGPPKWSPEDAAWMKALSKITSPNEIFTLDQSIGLYTEGLDPYGQDDGELSWHIPLGRVNWAVPRQIPFHSWATTALSGCHAGYAGGFMASEVLALSIIDLLNRPSLIESCHKELKRRIGDYLIEKPRYSRSSIFTQNPKAFWDAVWN